VLPPQKEQQGLARRPEQVQRQYQWRYPQTAVRLLLAPAEALPPRRAAWPQPVLPADAPQSPGPGLQPQYLAPGVVGAQSCVAPALVRQMRTFAAEEHSGTASEPERTPPASFAPRAQQAPMLQQLHFAAQLLPWTARVGLPVLLRPLDAVVEVR
jgi:hypothetical protein